MEATTTVGILLSMFISFIYGNLKSTIVFSPSELEKDSNLLNNSLKFALRYGFQKTSDCKDFPKAYICIQKCLDLGYDVAHSDRYCFCTCFYKSGKPKYTPSDTVTKTKWKHGAPTTKLPVWATTNKKDKILNDNDTDIEYILVDGNATDLTTEHAHENSTADIDTHSTDNSTDNSTATNVSDDGNTGTVTDGDVKTGGTGDTNDETKDENASDVTNNPTNADSTDTGDADTGGTQNPDTDQPDGTSGGTEHPADDTTAS